jgi:hypothetical protein
MNTSAKNVQRSFAVNVSRPNGVQISLGTSPLEMFVPVASKSMVIQHHQNLYTNIAKKSLD